MDSRAIAPEVGTYLLVAVTVIVASVLAVFAFDVGEKVQDPSLAAGFEYDWQNQSGTLTVAHDGGDVFTEYNTERLEVVIRDESEGGGSQYRVARADWANQNNGRFPVGAGDSFTITGEGGGGDLDVERDGETAGSPGTRTHEPATGDLVQIIWYGHGNRTFIVSEYVVPGGQR